MQEHLGRGWAMSVALCLYAATIDVSRVAAMFAAVAFICAAATIINRVNAYPRNIVSISSSIMGIHNKSSTGTDSSGRSQLCGPHSTVPRGGHCPDRRCCG